MVLSTGANAALGFLSGILLVTGLAQDEYGLVSSALAVFLVAQEFVGRGINDSMMSLGTLAAAGSRDRSNEIFRAGLLLKALVALAFFAVLRCVPQLVVKPLGRPELAAAFPGVAAAVAGFALWSFILTRRQASLEFGALAAVQPINNALRVGLLILFVAFGALTWTRAIWILAGSMIVSALAVGARDWLEIARLRWTTKRVAAAAAEVWRYGGWNMVAAIAFVAYTRMDVFVLTRRLASSDVAVYNAAWQVLTSVDLAGVAIMTVMIPKVCHMRHREDFVSWMARSLRLSAMVALLSLPLPLLADWYVPLLFGTEYAASAALVRNLYWGSLIAQAVFPLIGILYATRSFRTIAAIHVTLLAASVPSYELAVKAGGVAGAAWTTVAMRVACSALLFAAVLRRVLQAPRRDSAESPVVQNP